MCNRAERPCEDGSVFLTVTSAATTPPHCVSFPCTHDTWQLGCLFFIFTPGFLPPSPPKPPIFEHTVHNSHPPVLLHLKALDSEGREINRGGDNLDTGEAFSARAVKHTWCYYHLWRIIRPLIIVINQSSGSLMHCHKTQHHSGSTWAVLTYEKSMCSHDSRQKLELLSLGSSN